MSISASAYIIAVPGQISSETGGEFVVLNLDTGMYHGFEGPAARAWSLVREGSTVEAIEATLIAEFDVDEARCRADLQQFLQDLHARGLVEIRDVPAP